MTTPARPARPAKWPMRLPAVLLALALAAGGCTGGEDEPAEPAATSSPARPTPPPVTTAVSYGKVTGRLPGKARTRLAGKVRKVVDRWLDAAYLRGNYPRRAFKDSWPGFTAGARQEAHRDRALMSNEDIGTRIDAVRARHKRVRLDVLAVRRHPVGVTAHVLLVFATSGRLERVVRVQGRLYLTHGDRGWRVFGYDMTKGDVR